MEQMSHTPEEMRREERHRRQIFGQCDSEVPGVEDKPWENGKLRSFEQGMPRLKEENLEEQRRATRLPGCGL